MRFDRCQQRIPGHHLVHLGQEGLTTRLFALAGLFGVGEAELGHRCAYGKGAFQHMGGDLFRASLGVS